ncbi:MAG: hypothetical protein QOF14_4922 [Hyphomicrobiales bacterium]|jgi:hypothetical protein|nr:hypothetical protein [Hyphomicrobiales bacterium]
MADISFEPFSTELRSNLENLAAGIFDLAGWISEPDKYKPAQTNLPWRSDGRALTPKDIGVIPFFENLLRGTSSDGDLGAHWSALAADALHFCPVEQMAAWRKNRGLSASPMFGTIEIGNKASNIWVTDSAGTPISRGAFYSACWPLLKAVIDDKPPASIAEWKTLADDLANDRRPKWPNTSSPKSSAFLVQFASDMLSGMLGMRTPAASPWREALLIELGEYRRVGNKYSVADTDAAVKEFRKALGL